MHCAAAARPPCPVDMCVAVPAASRDNPTEDSCCPVCTDFFLEPVRLACGHLFCRLCIERAIDRTPQCPLCRADVDPKDLRPCDASEAHSKHYFVRCPWRCGWTGPCSQREAHAAQCCPVAGRFENKVVVSGYIGLRLESLDGDNLMVDLVRSEGAIAAHNKQMVDDPDKQVRTLDVLVEVNGRRGNPDELVFLVQRSLLAGCMHRLVFHRPAEFAVSVDASCGRLGLEFDLIEQSTPGLVVRKVLTGAVQEHNKLNADCQVLVNDRIVEVDGHRGSALELLARLLSMAGVVKHFDLKVLRTGRRTLLVSL